MASVSVASSLESRPRRKTAIRKAAIWASVTSCLLGVRLTMARMKARISASVRARPSRLWRMTSMGWMVWVMYLVGGSAHLIWRLDRMDFGRMNVVAARERTADFSASQRYDRCFGRNDALFD